MKGNVAVPILDELLEDRDEAWMSDADECEFDEGRRNDALYVVGSIESIEEEMEERSESVSSETRKSGQIMEDLVRSMYRRTVNVLEDH
jgi:hypothetical protein